MKPFFSIIIPCCNVEPYIEECLLSILNQPFQDWECLITVETSRDKTEQIVRSFAEKDPRIRYFTQPRSGSPSAGRNTGLEHAQGEYVIFVDGDDCIRENKLEELAAGIAQHSGADLYPCAVLAYDTRTGEEKTYDNYQRSAPAGMSFPEAIPYMRHSEINPMAPMTIYRLEFLNKAHLRFVYGLVHEDNEFFPRTLFYAKRIVPLHILFYYYRIVPNSIMTTLRPRTHRLKAAAKVFRKHLIFYDSVSKAKEGVNPVVSRFWADQWLSWIWGGMFYSCSIYKIPYKYQVAILRFMLADNLGAFRLLAKHAPPLKRLACYFLPLPVIYPAWTIRITYSFFQIYFRLADMKNNRLSLIPHVRKMFS